MTNTILSRKEIADLEYQAMCKSEQATFAAMASRPTATVLLAEADELFRQVHEAHIAAFGRVLSFNELRQ